MKESDLAGEILLKRKWLKYQEQTFVQNINAVKTALMFEFYTARGSQTINKICTYNPVRPIIGNHGRHVCPNWCPGAGCVVLKIEE